MSKPHNPYRYRIGITKGLMVHHLDEYHDSAQIALCGKNGGKWLDLWITQQQLEAIGPWCPKCIEVIS